MPPAVPGGSPPSKRFQRPNPRNLGAKKLPKIDIASISSPRFEDCKPSEDWVVTVPRRWLPADFVHSPNTRSARSLHGFASAGSTARSVVKESRPKLPVHLEEVLALIPLKLQPQESALRECVDAPNPTLQFASILVDSATLQRLQCKPHWDDELGALELCAETEPVSSAQLAAATALHRKDCEQLSIGKATADLDLRMLRSWSALKTLELKQLSVGPACKGLPETTQNLSLEFCSWSGPPPRIVADALPPQLRELRISGAPATGLEELVKKTPSLIWVNCAYWWEAIPIPDLLRVAEMLASRGGHFVWQSKRCLMQAALKEKDAIRKKNIMTWANQAAILHVQRVQNQIQEHGHGLDLLGKALSYARAMKCDAGALAPAKDLLNKMHLSVVFQRREIAERLGLATLGTTSDENAIRKIDVKAHMKEVMSAKVIGIEELIETFINSGFEEEVASSLAHYIDCDWKGFVTFEDVANMLSLPDPASTQDLYDFYIYLMKAFPSLKAAFAAFDKEGNGDISLLEFEVGLENCSIRRSNKVPARSLFAALDASRMSGTIDQEEFALLSFFSNIHRMTHVEKIHNWIVETYGDLTSGFKAIDENKSGAVSKEEFEADLQKHGYRDWSMVTEVFNFIEPDGSGVLSLKKMLKLSDVNVENFLSGVRQLVNELQSHFGSLEKAYQLMGCSNDEDESISLSEFVNACNRLDMKRFSEIDPRMLYNFLDDTQDGSVTAEEFFRLACFNADSARSGLMESLKDFRTEFGSSAKEAFNALQERASSEVLEAAEKAYSG